MPTLNQRLQKFKLDYEPFPVKKWIDTLGTFPLHNQIIWLTKLANFLSLISWNKSSDQHKYFSIIIVHSYVVKYVWHVQTLIYVDILIVKTSEQRVLSKYKHRFQSVAVKSRTYIIFVFHCTIVPQRDKIGPSTNFQTVIILCFSRALFQKTGKQIKQKN